MAGLVCAWLGLCWGSTYAQHRYNIDIQYIYIYIYIYKRYTSLRVMDPLIHHPDQPTGHRPSQSTFVWLIPVPRTHQTDSHALRTPHVDPARPCWPCAPLVQAMPRSSQHGPQPSRWTPHSHDPVRLNHFCGSLSHFDKASAIFSFRSIILLHYCYSA
jgi:hypothetical protein